MTRAAILYLGALALIFAGERVWPDSGAHWVLTGLGLLLALGSAGSRFADMGSESHPTRKNAHRTALIYTLVGLSSLVLYMLTTRGVVDALGFDEDAEARWSGVWQALMPIVWVVGTLPMLFLDRALSNHPVLFPARAARRASEAGVATALGLSLLFPVNYLASQYKWEYDAAYFRTTDAGSATLALVRTLGEPVNVYLFFPASSDVKEELLPYFERLQSASDGLLTVKVVDQALDPQLSEELKIRDNGYVAFVQGDANEKLKIGTDLDRARSKLKKLDEMVQEHLLSIAKGQRVAYMFTGHGEANHREKDDPLRKLNLFRQLLEAQNFKVENLGATEGSTQAIPDDASVVILAGPTKPLLPEEVEVLKDYYDNGGSLYIAADPGADPMTDLLAHLGVSVGTAPLAHARSYISQKRGNVDRVILATNRFGTHDAVTTVSKNSTQVMLVTPTVVSVDKIDSATDKQTTLVRSLPDTFEDKNGNYRADPEETSKVWDLAVAIEGGEGEGTRRAIVVGDVNLLADPVLQYSEGNAIFAADALRWLVGEESLVGETQNEEDVRIQHTRDEDVAWFWSTIFAFPALILMFGAVFTRMRRTK